MIVAEARNAQSEVFFQNVKHRVGFTDSELAANFYSAYSWIRDFNRYGSITTDFGNHIFQRFTGKD